MTDFSPENSVYLYSAHIERLTQVALDKAPCPTEIPLVQGVVKPHSIPKSSHRFLGGALAQNGLGYISRHYFDQEEYQDRHSKNSQERKPQPLGKTFQKFHISSLFYSSVFKLGQHG